jgi:hypothetical protein
LAPSIGPRLVVRRHRPRFARTGPSPTRRVFPGSRTMAHGTLEPEDVEACAEDVLRAIH